jgi:NADH pyrophosphatase NudC (nudix superfamily)
MNIIERLRELNFSEKQIAAYIEKWKAKTKFCVECGTEFIVTRPNKRFCSQKCAVKCLKAIWYQKKKERREQTLSDL